MVGLGVGVVTAGGSCDAFSPGVKSGVGGGPKREDFTAGVGVWIGEGVASPFFPWAVPVGVRFTSLPPSSDFVESALAPEVSAAASAASILEIV